MWRPSSATAEDRNSRSSPSRQWPSSGGGRPPRRPRIATDAPHPRLLPVPGGGRPPRRPRIATWHRDHAADHHAGWRPSSATAEDRNAIESAGYLMNAAVAAVLRDGRGSQLDQHHLHRGCGRGWRPSSATAEDRNLTVAEIASMTRCGGRPPRRPRIATVRRGARPRPTGRWRPSSATAEDRNFPAQSARSSTMAWWRPSSATAEDRNTCSKSASRPAAMVAAVLHDGRGSQLQYRPVPRADGRRWRPSSATAEDRNVSGRASRGWRARGGGRPPRRPRIATASRAG